MLYWNLFTAWKHKRIYGWTQTSVVLKFFISKPQKMRFINVEPKQVLYWNLPGDTGCCYVETVEPKQVLYWNIFCLFKSSLQTRSWTQTSVVLKLHNTIKTKNAKPVEPKQVLYWNDRALIHFLSRYNVEPKQVLYWNHAKCPLS